MPDDEQYYIRVRGRTLGPFDIDKLKQLHSRGQFGRAHEVSTDRQTWMSSGNLLAKFSGQGRASSTGTAVQAEQDEYSLQAGGGDGNPGDDLAPPAPGPPSNDQWYCARQGEKQGPMTLSVLQSLIFQGQLSNDDLVWSPGFGDWTPLSQVPQLQPGAPPESTSVSGGESSNSKGQLDSKVHYAGFWIRLMAFFIDRIIQSLIGFVLGFLIGFLLILSRDGLSNILLLNLPFLGFMLGTIIDWLYHALMESSLNQATIGKMAVGIQVTDEKGKRMTFGRASGRHFSKYISAIVFCIGFIHAAFSDKKQAWHDLICNTFVIFKPRD